MGGRLNDVSNQARLADPVSTVTRWSWGLGSFGTITYINTVTALVLVYLTTIVKIDPLLAGALVTGARVFDAFTDPFMGYITERTRTRIGRRRPYLLLGAFICGVALPLVYHIPLGGDESTRIAWVIGALLLYSIGFTVFNVPYLTMPVEMTNDPQERVSIISSRVLFLTLGSFAGGAFAPAALERLGRDESGFAQMGLIFGALVFATMLITFFGTRAARTREFVAHHVSLAEQWRTALQN